MSTTECDTDTSYQSDDSDINFIPGVVEIEDSEAHELSKRAREEDDAENMPGLAYSEEPLADEEWTKTYQQGQNERIEFEKNCVKDLKAQWKLVNGKKTSQIRTHRSNVTCGFRDILSFYHSVLTFVL